MLLDDVHRRRRRGCVRRRGQRGGPAEGVIEAELGAVVGEDGVEVLLPGAGERLDRLKDLDRPGRSEEHTSELQSLMRISYAVFCLKKKKTKHKHTTPTT